MWPLAKNVIYSSLAGILSQSWGILRNPGESSGILWVLQESVGDWEVLQGNIMLYSEEASQHHSAGSACNSMFIVIVILLFMQYNYVDKFSKKCSKLCCLPCYISEIRGREGMSVPAGVVQYRSKWGIACDWKAWLHVMSQCHAIFFPLLA